MLSTLVCEMLSLLFIILYSRIFHHNYAISTLIFMFCCYLQACSQEGASKVFELLQGKAFRSVGWSTLFDCLSIYDEKFKQSIQTAGAMLPEFPEGDAKALVAYLNVLQKVPTCSIIQFFHLAYPVPIKNVSMFLYMILQFFQAIQLCKTIL